MGRRKNTLIVAVIMTSVLFTSCNAVQKVEKQTKVNREKSGDIKVSEMVFETKSISEIRENKETSMSVLGTGSSRYGNILKTDIVPIITDKDEIYNIKLEKSEGNELTSGSTFSTMLGSKEIININKVYRNDKERIKTKLNITDGTDIEELIKFTEDYMDTTFKDSPFKWVVEYAEVMTSSDKQDFVSVYIRPSYDGVVFTRTLVLNNGIPTNTASDFRGGLLSITSMNKVYEYQGISPYYEVEKQGDAISEILSIDSVLSIVANKIDKNSTSEIKLFELAYRLNKDLSAVPIWNIVIKENENDRNFQIDAVTGDVYFE